MNTTPVNAAATTAARAHNGDPSPEDIHHSDRQENTSTIAIESIRARIGIGASPSTYFMYGPKNRFRSSRRSNNGQPLAKHHEAMIRKIVVGRPGTNTPTAPSATHNTPIAANPQRTARPCDDDGAGNDRTIPSTSPSPGTTGASTTTDRETAKPARRCTERERTGGVGV